MRSSFNVQKINLVLVQLCSEFKSKLTCISMSKSTKKKLILFQQTRQGSSLPQDSSSSLSSLHVGLGALTSNMCNFQKGCRKFIKDLNKTLLAIKLEVSKSPLAKELNFIQEGLQKIQNLTCTHHAFTEKHFQALGTTPQNSMSRLISSESLTEPLKRPVVDDSSSSEQPLKKTRTDVDFPDSSAMDLLLAPTDGNFVNEGEWTTVFVDGACSDNGKTKAKAGVGVWFYANCPFNVAEPVRSARHTNNVAEIEASIRAVEQAYAAGIKKLRVKTDSMFLINCITKWRFNWARNGWKTAGGKPVINKPELEQLTKVMKQLPVEVDWVHVKGHSGVIGNEAADFLARQGAEKKCAK